MPAPSHPALVTRWRSLLDVTGRVESCTWEDVFRSLSSPSPYRGDNDHPGWSPVECEPPTRRDEHVKRLSALVLDYDGTCAVEAAAEAWRACYGLIHTTRKHTEAVHRFRVVLPLSRYATPSEYATLWSWAARRAGVAGHRLDASTRNVSRYWYLPGVAEGGPFESVRLDGSPLDVDAVLAECARERLPPAAPQPPAGTPITLRIRRASHYIAKMDPAVAGQGGHLQTWKVALVLCRGFDLPADVALDLLAREFNPRCQPVWSRRELEHKIANALAADRVPAGYLLDDGADDWHTRVAPPPPVDDDPERAAIQGEAAPPAPSPSVFVKLDAAAIFAPLPPVPWLVERLGLTPGAPTLFAGYGYSRKTVAAQSLALSIASGRPIWGEFPCRAGRVLHLDYEQGSRLSRERYQRLAHAMGLTAVALAGLIDLVCLPSFYLDTPGAADVLAREFDGYAVAIIDSFRAAAPSADENSSDVRRHLDVFTRASEKTGTTPIVIHHARKPNAENRGDARMAIRGSSGIFDACDSIYVFAAEKGEPTAVHHEKARTLGVLGEDFHLDTADVAAEDNARAGLRVFVAAPEAVDAVSAKRSTRFQQLKDAVFHCIRQEVEVRSLNAICAKVAGGNKTSKAEALRELISEGRIAAVGGGEGGPYRVSA